MTVEILRQAHRDAPPARLVCDLNRPHWWTACSTVDAQQACLIREQDDDQARLGRPGAWERATVVLLRLPREGGFAPAECLQACDDPGMDGYFGKGKSLFVAGNAETTPGRRGLA